MHAEMSADIQGSDICPACAWTSARQTHSLTSTHSFKVTFCTNVLGNLQAGTYTDASVHARARARIHAHARMHARTHEGTHAQMQVCARKHKLAQEHVRMHEHMVV